MAIPSGSGTEVVKTATIKNSDSNWDTLINGVANHIYTILSITLCETAGTARTFKMRVYTSNGTGDDIYVIQDGSIPANGTFVFNDKFSFTGDAHLDIRAIGAVDILVTYIDQDWS